MFVLDSNVLAFHLRPFSSPTESSFSQTLPPAVHPVLLPHGLCPDYIIVLCLHAFVHTEHHYCLPSVLQRKFLVILLQPIQWPFPSEAFPELLFSPTPFSISSTSPFQNCSCLFMFFYPNNFSNFFILISPNPSMLKLWAITWAKNPKTCPSMEGPAKQLLKPPQ